MPKKSIKPSAADEPAEVSGSSQQPVKKRAASKRASSKPTSAKRKSTKRKPAKASENEQTTRTSIESVFTKFDAVMTEVESMELAGGEAVFFCARAPDKATANEDALAILTIDPTSCILIVADGCGGEAFGREAAQLTIAAVVTSVQQSPVKVPVRDTVPPPALVQPVVQGDSGAQAAVASSELDLSKILEQVVAAEGQVEAQPESDSVTDSSQLPPPLEPKSWRREAIFDGFERANRQVHALGAGSATTLLVVEIIDDQIRSYHAGDSQATLLDDFGDVKFQTVSHSPVGYALEAGMLSEEEALTHEDLHVVSNVIGAEQPHIDVGMPHLYEQGDTLLLGSDGVYDNLTIDEISDLLDEPSLRDAGERMRLAISERMTGRDETSPSKPDDCTFILFRRG